MNKMAQYPQVRFVELDDRTEKGLLDYLYSAENAQFGLFMVCLRCKYACDEEWEYLTEACSHYWDNMSVCWFNDWDEGQEEVEYFAVAAVSQWGGWINDGTRSDEPY